MAIKNKQRYKNKHLESRPKKKKKKELNNVTNFTGILV